MGQEKSELVKAIEARPRKTHEFEVQDFFGLGDKPVHKIAIRVATKAEQDDAVVRAHERVCKETESAVTARSDSDILTDAKAIEILFKCCRRVDDGSTVFDYPAFPGPDWMRKNMTTDQIAVLLNLYHEVRRADEPIRWTIDSEQLDSLSKMCAERHDTDLPEALLATCNREWLTQAFVLLSMRLHEDQSDEQRRGGDDDDDMVIEGEARE